MRRARLWVARALFGRGRRRSGDAMSSASQNAAIRVHHPGFPQDAQFRLRGEMARRSQAHLPSLHDRGGVPPPAGSGLRPRVKRIWC